MNLTRLSVAACLLVFLLIGASYPRQVLKMEITANDQGEMLVIHTRGDVASPSAYSRDSVESTLSFLLNEVGADAVELPPEPGRLITGVKIQAREHQGSMVTVSLSNPEIITERWFRFSHPKDHIVLLEVYENSVPSTHPVLKDEELQSGEVAPLAAIEQPAAGVNPSGNTGQGQAQFDPDRLGIVTVDLTDVEPQRVLGLAADLGLIDTKGTALTATQGLGSLSVEPAGQSLVSWSEFTPPEELFLTGSEAELAEFLRLAEPRYASGYSTLTQWWAQNRPRTRARTVMGTNPDTRNRVKDDPYEGLYYDDFKPGARMLSDVRVTLPAAGGMNLYAVIEYLSLISGISIILDPYMFDEPFGGTRPPLEPEPIGGDADRPGFRPAGVFEPVSGGTGTVQGNFVDVPFDTALELILGLHNLEYIVYYGDDGQSGAKRYGSGKPAGSNTYEKPMVLITSRERMEQELPGTSQIDLYQLHYVDPTEMTAILDNLDMLPGTGTGWYVYGNGGIATQGTGGGVGGGATGGRPSPSRFEADLYTYRGADASPVYEVVREAAEDGEHIIRVLLSPVDDGMQVTSFAR